MIKIKISAKSTLTKTLILLIVSALMLSTSTYAWFSAGSAVSVDKIIAHMDGPSALQSFTIKEAIDVDFDGERDDDGTEPYSNTVNEINISQMQPGKFNFYKMEILAKSGKSIYVKFNDITVPSISGITDQEIMENIVVNFRVDVNNEPGNPTSTTLWDILQNPGTEGPYTATLNEEPVTSATIYLDIGINGEDENGIHNTEAFQSVTSLSFAIAMDS
ncbi:MAG: hypothetical protein K5756_01330 [Clostridiales bacterium]|nr:hypothetical protein [Clostridiales bacterium]